MNRLVTAVKSLDVSSVRELIRDPKWAGWSEPSGKNALHYVCGVNVGSSREKAGNSLTILKMLLKSGLDINSIHRIEDKNCEFPATPLWYAYTKGRNETLYKYLLNNGADSRGCWWAIAWYDDVKAGELWLKHGAELGVHPTVDDLFVGTFAWKKMTFAKWLLDKGADVNARGPDGLSALMIAVKRKDEDAIRMLLKHGADPDVQNEKGMSARSLANEKGPKRILDLF